MTSLEFTLFLFNSAENINDLSDLIPIKMHKNKNKMNQGTFFNGKLT